MSRGGAPALDPPRAAADHMQIPVGSLLHYTSFQSVSKPVSRQGRQTGKEGGRPFTLTPTHSSVSAQKGPSRAGARSQTSLCVCVYLGCACVCVWKSVCACVFLNNSVIDCKILKNHRDFGSLICDWDRHLWIFYLLQASCSPMSYKAPRL